MYSSGPYLYQPEEHRLANSEGTGSCFPVSESEASKIMDHTGTG